MSSAKGLKSPHSTIYWCKELCKREA